MPIGWWLAPLAITLLSFGWAILTPASPYNGSKYFPDPMPFIRLVGAIVISLVAWLVWALFR